MLYTHRFSWPIIFKLIPLLLKYALNIWHSDDCNFFCKLFPIPFNLTQCFSGVELSECLFPLRKSCAYSHLYFLIYKENVNTSAVQCQICLAA